MKRIGLMIGFLAVLVIVLPSLTAQDKKKDPDKNEKKTDEVKKDDEKKDAKKDDEKKDAKKGDEKKDAKKDDEKKEEKKKPEPKKAPEKLVYGAKFITKIVSFKPESNRDFTINVMEVDPKKVYDLQVWKNQQMQSLAQAQYAASRATTVQQQISQQQSYQKAMYTFQMALAQKQNNIYSSKPMDVRAAENVKVRTLFPPVEFTDEGFQKKWTKKELEERRDKTGLPGFAVELDALKSGQIVELYMAKVAPPAKGAKKKGPDDDDPVMTIPEFVMVVIKQEAK